VPSKKRCERSDLALRASPIFTNGIGRLAMIRELSVVLKKAAIVG
jgi:hypothetical protein